MANKFRLFRGLTGVSLVALSLMVFGSILAFENSGQVNVFLNINNSTSGHSNYSSVDEMRIAERKNEVITQEEGSVLLFNNNKALPLQSTNKVTLLGRTAADNIFKGGSGGSTTTDEAATSLYEVLKDKGFSINEKVYSSLKSSDISRSRGNIGEVPSSFYTDDLKSTFSDYSDAAIIVLGRYSGEQQDFTSKGDSNQDNSVNENNDPIDVEGVPMLSLHESEREMIKIAKDSGVFKKIIVILNTATTMEIDDLESLGVDSCLWVGYPGFAGFEGVANILAGEADPSGRTVDTFATDSLSSPAMRNYGTFSWDNVTTDGQSKYLVYAEDIYTGYKYYETRYHDQILNINNAKSSSGCYNSNGNWNYADEMTYSFGHGISYASFNEEVNDITWNRETHQVTCNVTVKNTNSESNYKGESKDVVELYVSLPFQSGQAEKSAIQLIGYTKTKGLKPGDSQKVQIIADDYLFATYDNNAINGADTTKKGSYVFDAGDYFFAIGSDAHDALNNVLASQNVVSLIDEKGKTVDGDSNKVHKETLASLDNKTYAVSPDTGEIVSNHFDDMDINYYESGAVTYLTRNDWNTYPNRITGLSATDEMKTVLDGHTYTKPSDAKDINEFKYSQNYDTPITLKDMKNVDYENQEKWDSFIDQLTPTQLAKIPGEKFGNDAISELGVPTTQSADGPDGIQANTGFSHVSEVVSTSTYNDELIANRGKFMGEDGMASGQSGVYGFGANMHRTPYGGRNFEYYSEDMILSYLAGGVQTKAANEMGLTTYVKHFCANDQEVWRNGSSTIMTEQTYRQGPLKGFEGSFTKGGSLGTMTSNARVGLKVVSMDYETMTTVLRKEWGFKGVSMTDSSKGSRYYLYTQESIAAGIDQFNNDETRGTSDMKNYLIKEKDGYMWQRCREIAKNYFYMLTKNFVMTSDEPIVVTTPWWETAIYSILGVGIGVSVALLSFTVFFGIKDKKRIA
ncbi:MAG: glycoside hydrolase family 3 C-terminal domain-containing protein [Bacilli bacterium]